ncbi:glycosyltransferase [Flavobacterium sediminilitoris]|uniref:Glycosyltransferase n=1 Tax=Flavobacterium sediminilitoris TaxID=2024526 RepID=A0ABY4HIU3_9FLAO|nr:MULTISPECIES: glycosyltransferase [Flavobacterium]UOX32758.1 glycosyltransferase [Flavobacterium sediminilitoris]
MNILLLGEYSNLHNSLKEGLIAKGHKVKILGTGDHFKKYNIDYSIYPYFFNRFWIFKKIKHIFHIFFKVDLSEFETAIRFYYLLTKLNNFDHVQLINSNAIETFPFCSQFLYKKLFKKVKKRSLLVCGDETPVIDYLLKKELKYSILTPYFKDPTKKDKFHYSLKYSKNNYRKVFNWLIQNCQVLICSDIDYKIPMEKMNYTINFIPNPINTDRIQYINLENREKTIIFLGINRGNYIKKGIIYFEKALKIVKQKYKDKIEIIISEDLPYNEYIEKYNSAHILLDQVYAYDQGYNALEAMAKGKIVFTGAETEFLNFYNLDEDEVCINALPCEKNISNKLSLLIENPEKMIRISKNARHFINKEHNYKLIADRYLNIFNSIN